MGHGIPSEYQQALIHLEQEDPEVLAKHIEGICGWDEARLSKHQLIVNDFVMSNKSWQAQGKRALEWMQSIVKKKNSA